MAQNGVANGVNGHTEYNKHSRFSDIPAVIDIPVRGEDGDEAVNLDLTELLDETDELCDLLENENAARNYWITIALAYAKQNKVDVAIDILNKGLNALARARPEDRLSILACICWLLLWKARHAPRVKPTQPGEDERTKDHFLSAATSALNDASRINPSYPPLFLARGTLSLLRASLQPSRSGPGSQEFSEKVESLKQALKSFDDAYKVSKERNVMALLGKAKAQFSLGRYAESLQNYQHVLERAPDMIDPDPRIGIGCCLWQLGHKEHARSAWQRSLDLNDKSQIAHVLLGLFYLDDANSMDLSNEAWRPTYQKAMTTHTQTAFKIDGMHPLTCATFGTYFLLRKTWANVERLARRAIENTDVNAIASDGWYLLAKKEHQTGDVVKASEYYTKADQARGGDEAGFLPAKFGVAQLRAEANDYDGAKFRLEKIVEKSKNFEAMTLLGILQAEEVFAVQASGVREDKSTEMKRAIGLLEQVRIGWKDAKRKVTPDPAVLLNLARLYESDQPDKALACLKQVEEMAMEDISDDDLTKHSADEAEERRFRRELISPQLLNNIGCFNFRGGKLAEARDDFQTALNACVETAQRGEGVETDALVTTISYNLARTYEAEGMDDEAKKIYQGLLERHADYVDANTRLAFIAHRSDPAKGAEAIKLLVDSDPANLEVRSLYGWFINRSKKRTLALNEDLEQRHYKGTLQTYDKHDLYSLTGMGNLHLAVAREMPRDTDQHKERRSKMYMRAVEFFDKVLALDPRNAYAAQGMAIALMDEKKETSAAIQIFSKVRETIHDASVHINLGHVFAEVKQYTRAIENYELALAKSKDKDLQVLACLGRVWLMRGRQERKLDAYKMSLDYSKQALASAPENIAFRFNVAFVQIQLAQMIITLPEAQKTSIDVEEATSGLDAAIEAFGEIAKAPNPPFPRNDIEQRANMGRNTMKRQLAEVTDKQTEYERKNATRLEEARRKRDEAIAAREAEKRAALEREEERRRKIAEERERMAARDRELIAARLEEEKAKFAAEYTTDEETGEKRKREKKKRSEGEKKERASKRKKGKPSAGGVSDSEVDNDDDLGLGLGGSGDEGGGTAPRKRRGNTEAEGLEKRSKKKRKLESRRASGKYKSADIVVSDDSDEDMGVAPAGGAGGDGDGILDDEEEEEAVMTPGAGGDDGDSGAEADDAPSRAAQRKKATRVVDDEDEDE